MASNLAVKLSYDIPSLKLFLVHEAQPGAKTIAINTPGDIEEFLQPLKHAAEEHFLSLHLNTKNEIIGLHEVSHGTLAASLVHPREVFKAALLSNSYAIIVCHNHPSGAKLIPSHEDLDTTRQLLKAGALLGVNLVDHLIFGPLESAISIRERHPYLWKS